MFLVSKIFKTITPISVKNIKTADYMSYNNKSKNDSFTSTSAHSF